MGNTPSTPPPLVSINAAGNEILVPFGTELYAYPPPPPALPSKSGGGACAHNGATAREGGAGGPVYRLVETPYRSRPGRKRHGHGCREADLTIREYGGGHGHGYGHGGAGTELGEVPSGYAGYKETRMRRKGNRMQGESMGGRWRPETGPFDVDARPVSAPMGYVDMRGRQGQGHPTLDHADVNGMQHSSLQPGMLYPLPPLHPSMFLHPPLPSQYASHETMLGPPLEAGGLPNANPSYTSRSSQPPPSTSSPPPSPKPPVNRLPPGIQAAIDTAVQQSASLASRSKPKSTQSNDSPTSPAKKGNTNLPDSGWGDGIDTCICTTNCKCRRGERATGWYEGVAEVKGERVPVRGKLNTRWVLTGDLSEGCGDYTMCRKSPSSSRSSEAENPESRHGKKNRNRKKQEKRERNRAEELKSKVVRVEKMAAFEQRFERPFSPCTGYCPDLDIGSTGMDGQHLDPTMLPQLERLRIKEMSDDLYEMDRMGGMDATGRMQGVTTRNLFVPQMPQRGDGMPIDLKDDWLTEGYEDIGGGSKSNPYAQRSATSREGIKRHLSQSKGATGLGFQGCVTEPASDLRTAFGRGTGKRQGNTRSNRQARGGFYPDSELTDSDLSVGSEMRPCTKGQQDNAVSEAATYNLTKHGTGNKSEDILPQIEGRRINPQSRRDRTRNGWSAGRQARVETEDDEDY